MLLPSTSSIAAVSILLLPSLTIFAEASVKNIHQSGPHHQIIKRAPTSTSASAASATRTRAAASSAVAPAAASSTLPSVPLPTTYAAGSTPTVKGAPPLPALASILPANYPALDKLPPLDSTQVKQWISQIDMSKVPNIPLTQLGGCGNASNAQAMANAAANGWWTCSGTTRNTDIVSCPDKMTWGLSYDDGPSPYTPNLLAYLDQNKLKSTFFVVGSRAISRPEMLQYEYMDGHQISVHTWSHPTLTTLTNEQIVAELGWTKQVIKDITGVTPNTMRPPFGDIDDRVRAISMQMGLTPIIWTSYQGKTFDTQDWQIGAGEVTTQQVVTNFNGILGNASSMSTGFIVLEHDLYPQSVDLAINYVLPQAIQNSALTLQPIYQCLKQPIENAYIETSSNSTNSTSALGGGSSASASSGGAAPTSKSGVAGGAAASGAASSSKNAGVRLEGMGVAVMGAIVGMVVGSALMV